MTGPCATSDTLVHPDHPEDDGSGDMQWPFLMIYGEQAVWADTRTELLGSVIGGYDSFDDGPDGIRDATDARYVHAVLVATAAQTSLLVSASEVGTFDPAAMSRHHKSDEHLQALMIERTVPFEPSEGSPLAGPDGPSWDCEVPLVLIASDYAPFSQRPRPTGRILWVDPSNEMNYLNSLADLGLIVLFTADPDETVSDQ